MIRTLTLTALAIVALYGTISPAMASAAATFTTVTQALSTAR